jgi:hypothetical protein
MKNKQMRIDGLIKRLQTVRKKYGNVPVNTLDYTELESNGEIVSAPISFCFVEDEGGSLSELQIINMSLAQDLDPWNN